MTWWQQPFFQISLPIMIIFVLVTWYTAIKDRRDALRRRIDDLLQDHERRIKTMEERTSPIRQ
jgi:di/tricarboxylate transporter